jgi:hypothetical protein
MTNLTQNFALDRTCGQILRGGTSSARLNLNIDLTAGHLESLSIDSRQHSVLWPAIFGVDYDREDAGHSGRCARTFVEPEWGYPRI